MCGWSFVLIVFVVFLFVLPVFVVVLNVLTSFYAVFQLLSAGGINLLDLNENRNGKFWREEISLEV